MLWDENFTPRASYYLQVDENNAYFTTLIVLYMENIEFRPLSHSDLTEVKLIYDYYIQNSTATFHTEPVGIDELASVIPIAHPRYSSFLIYCNNRLAGYCYSTYYKNRQAYNRTAEVTVYLKPEFLGMGIGTKALKVMEEELPKAGVYVLLGVITGDNHESIALFSKMGYTQCANFKRVGEKFGRILDVVVYQKELSHG